MDEKIQIQAEKGVGARVHRDARVRMHVRGCVYKRANQLIRYPFPNQLFLGNRIF